MKRLVVVALVLTVIAALSWQWIDGRAKEDAAKRAWIAAEEEAQGRVKALIARTRANAKWESELLEGEDFRASPVMTVEIERAWLTPYPIVFVGRIADIRSFDPSRYELTVRDSAYFYLAADLELSLLAPKELVDGVLATHPSLLDGDYLDVVAVVGLIGSVEVRQSVRLVERHRRRSIRAKSSFSDGGVAV